RCDHRGPVVRLPVRRTELPPTQSGSDQGSRYHDDPPPPASNPFVSARSRQTLLNAQLQPCRRSRIEPRLFERPAKRFFFAQSCGADGTCLQMLVEVGRPGGVQFAIKIGMQLGVSEFTAQDGPPWVPGRSVRRAIGDAHAPAPT